MHGDEKEEAYQRRMRKHRERGDFMRIVERECMKHGRVVFIIYCDFLEKIKKIEKCCLVEGLLLSLPVSE